mgnify:CR=1 FL=1
MILLISFFVFAFVICIFLVLYQTRAEENQNIQNRLDRYFELGFSSPEEKEEQHQQQSGEKLGAVRTIIRRLSKYVESPQFSKHLEHRLTQADIPMRGSEFLVIWAGVTIIAALLAFILSKASIVWTIIGGLTGCLLPDLYLKRKAKLRVAAFNGQLGDALVLIANSLRTGYSFLQAVELVSREMQAPIAVEFGRALREMNFGVQTEDALNNIAKRITSEDLDLVITAVVIQRQIGGNLAEILDKIAGTIRARVRLKGQVKTLTAQGRISGMVIGCLPFFLAMGLYAINPEYISLLFTEPKGRMALGVAGVMQVMGLWIISWIVDIEY